MDQHTYKMHNLHVVCHFTTKFPKHIRKARKGLSFDGLLHMGQKKKYKDIGVSLLNTLVEPRPHLHHLWTNMRTKCTICMLYAISALNSKTHSDGPRKGL